LDKGKKNLGYLMNPGETWLSLKNLFFPSLPTSPPCTRKNKVKPERKKLS